MYKWYYMDKVPTNIEVKQVYGIVFSNDGKVVLRVENGKYKLTGGRPNDEDVSLEDTLKREYLEELNIEIKDIKYLGYLLVEEDDEKYAQVRMIARINKIGINRPDLDNGKIYKRFMGSQVNVKKYLKYEDLAGNKMIDDALELANMNYDFDIINDDEYFIKDILN